MNDLLGPHLFPHPVMFSPQGCWVPRRSCPSWQRAPDTQRWGCCFGSRPGQRSSPGQFESPWALLCTTASTQRQVTKRRGAGGRVPLPCSPSGRSPQRGRVLYSCAHSADCELRLVGHDVRGLQVSVVHRVFKRCSDVGVFVARIAIEWDFWSSPAGCQERKAGEVTVIPAVAS